MFKKPKFETIDEELYYNSQLSLMASQYPVLVNKMDPEFFAKLIKKSKEDDPLSTIFGLFNMMKDFSEWCKKLEEEYEPQRSKLIEEHISSLKYFLYEYTTSEEITVEALKSMRVDLIKLLEVLEQLQIKNLNKALKKPKYPRIIKSHLATILANEKITQGSPVFGFSKSKLAIVAFKLFRDQKGKKFKNELSFGTLVSSNRKSNCKNNEKSAVVNQLRISINYINNLP